MGQMRRSTILSSMDYVWLMPRIRNTSGLPFYHKWSTTITIPFTPQLVLLRHTCCSEKDNLCTNVPLDEARRLAQERSESFKAKKKESYDRSHKALDLKVGDLVKRRVPHNHPKIQSFHQNSTPSTRLLPQYRPSTMKLLNLMTTHLSLTFTCLNWSHISNGSNLFRPRRVRQP